MSLSALVRRAGKQLTLLYSRHGIPVNPYSTMPQLTVTPQTAFVDDPIEIKATGLCPNQTVTVIARLEEKGVFTSSARFVADLSGNVDLTSQPSLGGTYTGVDAMGLLWSMCPNRGQRNTRLVKTDVTKPFKVDLSLLDGHVDHEIKNTDSNILASTTIERWYKHSSVQRIVIKEGDLRGTLFLPSGNGPLPGVIDMFGSTGGLVEHRAALLASRGFAVLALAYLGYDDLPKSMEDLDLDYFLNAVDWMSCHPAVKPGGVGIIGVSKGGEFGMLMAANNPKVKAVVNINGSLAYTFYNLNKGSTVFQRGMEIAMGRLKFTDQGVKTRGAYDGFDDAIIPFWKSDAQYLLLFGEDDQTWDLPRAQGIIDSIPVDKRKNVDLRYFPDAGHLIEPPYTPLCYSSFHRLAGMNIVWGGTPKPHARAQAESWRLALDFLRAHLGDNEQEQTNSAQERSKL